MSASLIVRPSQTAAKNLRGSCSDECHANTILFAPADFASTEVRPVFREVQFKIVRWVTSFDRYFGATLRDILHHTLVPFPAHPMPVASFLRVRSDQTVCLSGWPNLADPRTWRALVLHIVRSCCPPLRLLSEIRWAI